MSLISLPPSLYGPKGPISLLSIPFSFLF
ncbi:uncharacterized protein FTOL_13807 [Fusarium torulosum]|uniref:Uncharacterized protein n=1 Tax=Fusarium torulosum TaxID=33205 RepID=A0AAE8MP76_9HYPO|nr:uncharacterized protein FTOL_13807 [Fusarium torulosum]